MTEEWLRAVLARNPALSIHSQTATNKNILPPLEKTTPKYGNHKVYVYQTGIRYESDKTLGDAQVFASEREYKRFQELLLLERAHVIHNLKRQDKLLIQEGFVYRGKRIKAVWYLADATYDLPEGQHVVEDVKALDENGKHRTTETFNLKWKLLKHKYPQYVFLIY